MGAGGRLATAGAAAVAAARRSEVFRFAATRKIRNFNFVNVLRVSGGSPFQSLSFLLSKKGPVFVHVVPHWSFQFITVVLPI